MARRLRRDIHKRVTSAGYEKISGDLEVTGTIISPTIDNMVSALGTIVSGTTTPVKLTITECKGGFKSIVLRWPKQYNLMNFDRYELQVSANGTDWYALLFDGTDWKGALNGVTVCTGEMMVHVPIPFGGTEADPTAVTLYYRVRQATILSVYSTWSDAVTGTTNLLQNGDIAANVLTANKILAAEINTLLLRATAAVIIGYAGSGTNASPAEGDRRAYIDDDELGLEVYTHGAWSSERRVALGGVDAGGNFLPFLSCRGLLGDMDDAPVLDPIPAGFYRFSWNNVSTDQFGVDPWTFALGAFAYSAVTKWEGSHSLAQSAFGAYWANAWSIGDSVSIAFMFYDTGTNTPLTLFDWNDPSTADYIRLGYLNGHNFTLTIKKGGTVTSQDSSIYLTTNTWHFVGFTYDAAENKAYIRVDNQVDEMTPAGTWSAAAARSLFFYGASGYFIDDMMICNSAAIDPDLFFQHVTRGIAWTSDYSAEDVFLKARTGGKARLSAASIADLASYANNAAAVAAGLRVGDLYRIADTVGVVHA